MGDVKMFEEQESMELSHLLLETVRETAEAAHRYIESHPTVRSFQSYPIKEKQFYDYPEYESYRERLDVGKYKISKYELKSFPDNKYDYQTIFSKIFSLYDPTYSDYVKCGEFESFKKVREFIEAHENIQNRILKGEDSSKLGNILESIVTSIVERYLFRNNATGHIPDSFMDELTTCTSGKLKYFLDDELRILICIPLSLVTFDSESIQLSEDICILRIPEGIQQSRQEACRYEIGNEAWLAAAATHMLVIDSWYFRNQDSFSVKDAVHNLNNFPLDQIDNIMASIRIAAGCTVGYEQILTLPDGWYDGFFADLPIVYGTKIRKINPEELNKDSMQLKITKISDAQVEDIKKIYEAIEKHRQSLKKEDSQRLVFATKKYNCCMLRDDENDKATDATVGLESLLAGGNKAEISYTLGNRIPVVFKHIQDKSFTPANSREIMKKIYNYRSKIVHGSSITEKEKVISVGGGAYNIPDVAVYFLRCTLLFMLTNPKFSNSKYFDQYRDELLDSVDLSDKDNI